MTCGACALLFAGASAHGVEPRVELRVEEVLEAAREAAGRDRWNAETLDFELRGTSRIYGVDAPCELRLLWNGHYRFAIEGPLAYQLGWDGTTAWMRERRGPLRQQGRSDRVWSQLGQWVHSGFWCDAGAGLEVRVAAEDEDEVVLELNLTAEGLGGELVLSRATWRPSELRRAAGSAAAKVLYDDYRTVAGLTLAHRVRNITGGSEGLVQFEEGSALPAAKREPLAPGPRGPRDTRFVPDLEGPIEIRAVPSGHLLVRPLVDGEDIGWFIFDTGAGQICIDPKAADGLGLEAQGQVPAVGIAGQVQANFRHGTSLELGPLVIEEPVFVELDLAFLEPLFGLPVAGICGYDVFARAIIELDLEGPTAAVYDPEDYALASGAWTDLTLESRIPTIRCTFEGDRSGPFKIDTGATDNVAFHTAAVDRLGLLEGREVRDSQRGGVGGTGAVAVGIMEFFEIGGKRHERVSVTFDRGTVAGQADTSVLGTLGSGLLRPFRIVFDYPGRRIALMPREASAQR